MYSNTGFTISATGTVVNEFSSYIEMGLGDLLPQSYIYNPINGTFDPSSSWSSVVYLTSRTSCTPYVGWVSSTFGSDPAMIITFYSMKYLD